MSFTVVFPVWVLSAVLKWQTLVWESTVEFAAAAFTFRMQHPFLDAVSCQCN